MAANEKNVLQEHIFSLIATNAHIVCEQLLYEIMEYSKRAFAKLWALKVQPLLMDQLENSNQALYFHKRKPGIFTAYKRRKR